MTPHTPSERRFSGSQRRFPRGTYRKKGAKNSLNSWKRKAFRRNSWRPVPILADTPRNLPCSIFFFENRLFESSPSPRSIFPYLTSAQSACGTRRKWGRFWPPIRSCFAASSVSIRQKSGNGPLSCFFFLFFPLDLVHIVWRIYYFYPMNERM